MAYYFYLPEYTRLTIAQQSALNETRSIALSGGPGTGKSVVSLWRHIRNYSLDLRTSLLLTYTQSLRFYLQNSCLTANVENEEEKEKRDKASKAVNRSLDWLYNIHDIEYDEIIVDEAQDLGNRFYRKDPNFPDARCIMDHTNQLSYGADDNQMLYPPPPEKATSEEQLSDFFPDNVPFELGENFRNTLEILIFARDFFPAFNIPNTVIQILREKEKTGPKPQLLICENSDKQTEAIIGIINQFTSETHNIAILLPLQNQVSNFHSSIVSRFPDATYHTNGHWSSIGNIHVTTFKSAKGLEFDTVILPQFQNYSDNIQNLFVVEEKDYFVAFTRAKSNLFMISNNDLDIISDESCDKEIYNDGQNNERINRVPVDDLPF